jgi:esterase
MNLFYREYGQGKPIIILHGLMGFSDNWQSIAKGLAQDHLVITPDLRNHGRSPHHHNHSYPLMADDVKHLMETLWMFSATVIGHSMGGKVAMHLALHHPDAVDRLVVVDIEPGKAEDNHSGIFDALLSMDLSKMTSRQDAEAYLSDRIRDYGTRQFLLKNITREEDGTFTWKMNLPALWKNYPRILEAVSGEPFRKPALFIRGGRSDYIKESEWPHIKTLFPEAELVTIPDAGHWVHAEKPVELLQIIKNFL